MESRLKILIVDDDRDLVDLLHFALHRAGFEARTAYDGPTAVKLLEDDEPDLVVLDVNLGAWNGFELLKDIRRHSQVPVIMLTGLHTEDEKVRGLDLGADDYMTKPFSHRELVARIRANLRRRREHWRPVPAEQAVLTEGPVTLYAAEHRATRDGKPLPLTRTEFRLLQYLMANAGNVIPAQAIAKQVWGYTDSSALDVVRVTAYRLRRKLGEDATNPQLIHTVSGVGLMLRWQPLEGE